MGAGWAGRWRERERDGGRELFEVVTMLALKKELGSVMD